MEFIHGCDHVYLSSKSNVTRFRPETAPFSPHSPIISGVMEIRLGQARSSKMNKLLTSVLVGAIGAMTLGVVSASAAATPRPDYCSLDHDHRSHAADYYDYYDADRYYRGSRGSGVSVSISVGDDRYDRRGYDRRGYDRRGDYRRDNYNDRRGHRGRRGVVNRQVFQTRHRARIVLIEEVVRGRRGPRLICTVRARGPEARYVSERRMYRIANRNCSSRARVRVYA